MSDRPSMAIIGCGIISEMLLDGAHAAGINIRAVCDVDEERASQAARRFAADTCKDYADVLGRNDIEAVIIALPNFLHHETAVSAIEAGKHVFCEKPLTTDPQSSLDLVHRVEKSGRVLQVGYMKRFNPAFAAGKRLLDKIGPVTGASFRLTVNGNPALDGKPAEAKSWHADVRKSGGGFLVHSGSHLLDLMMFYFGAPISVCGSLKRDINGSEYANSFLLRFPADTFVTLQMFATRAQGLGYAGGVWEEKVEITGLNGRFSAEDADWQGRIPSRAFVHLADGEGPRALFTYWESQWAEELRAFEEGIKLGKCLGSSVVDGYRVDYILSELKELETDAGPIEFNYAV